MIIRDLLRRSTTPISSINNPNVPLYQALTGLLDGPSVHSGVTVSTDSAMRVVAVQACVRLIAETIAALPLRVMDGDGPNRQEVKQASEAHIWDRPNSHETKQDFWEAVLVSLLTDGNAFIRVFRTEAGSPSELELLDPRSVNIARAVSGDLAYEVAGDRTYSRVEMTHIPNVRMPGQLRGLSPIGLAREAIGLAIVTEQFGARYFGNGTMLGGLIETDRDLSANGGSAARALQQRWTELNAGIANAHKVAVLDNGGKFKPFGIPPEDSQFIESRRFQIGEIARLYRVPPHIIGDMEKSTSWGTGIEQQNIQLVTLTLLPHVRRLESHMTANLLPRRTRYAQIDLRGLLRGDAAARYTAYTAGRNGGWLSVNDIRRLEDLPPIDGGDTYLQPLNMQPVSEPAIGGADDGNADPAA